MPAFGQRSRDIRRDLDSDLVALVDSCIADGPDFGLVSGVRTEDEQAEKYRLKLSTLDGITERSMHQPPPGMLLSRAVDIAPHVPGRGLVFPDRGDEHWVRDLGMYYQMIGFIRCRAKELDIAIRCGADWDGDWNVNDQKFHDLGHVEVLP